MELPVFLRIPDLPVVKVPEHFPPEELSILLDGPDVNWGHVLLGMVAGLAIGFCVGILV